MTTIYKYHFEISDLIAIEMPYGAKVLSVHVQDGKPTMWCEVISDNETEMRKFYIVGTGHSMPRTKPLDYIATIQLDGYVWHIFE